jgi:hypothetical protein
MEDEEDDEEIRKAYPNEPTLLEMFPKNRKFYRDNRKLPDFTTLEPDDPLFLDMPWPVEAG